MARPAFLYSRAHVEKQLVGRRIEALNQPPPKFDAELADRLTFQPETRKGEEGFRFRATGTVEKLIAGLAPGTIAGFASGGVPNGPVEWCNLKFEGVAAA